VIRSEDEYIEMVVIGGLLLDYERVTQWWTTWGITTGDFSDGDCKDLAVKLAKMQNASLAGLLEEHDAWDTRQIHKDVEWDFAMQCVCSYRLAVDREGEVAVWACFKHQKKTEESMGLKTINQP